MTAGRTNEASSSHTNQRDLNRVAVSSLLGTSMEWYDYFLYGLFAALIFDKLFFPELPGAAGSVMALLTFAIGFVARPLGGVIFGHLGDRVGRKSTLIITLTVIGGATGLIGCLPTYSQIGVAAPIILASLRFIQGLSLGGEWGGAVLMVVEHAPKDKRAIYGAMPQLGSPIGTVLSSGVIAIVTLLPDEALMSWGWRLPFLLSFLMLAIALYMRLRVEESPVFKQLQAEADYNDEAKVKIPLFALLRSSLPQMALVIITCFFASGGFFLMTTYAVNYSTDVLGMTASLVLVATMVGAVLEAVGVVIGGRLGDRYSPASVVAGGGLLALIMIAPHQLWKPPISRDRHRTGHRCPGHSVRTFRHVALTALRRDPPLFRRCSVLQHRRTHRRLRSVARARAADPDRRYRMGYRDSVCDHRCYDCGWRLGFGRDDPSNPSTWPLTSCFTPIRRLSASRYQPRSLTDTSISVTTITGGHYER